MEDCILDEPHRIFVPIPDTVVNGDFFEEEKEEEEEPDDELSYEVLYLKILFCFILCCRKQYFLLLLSSLIRFKFKSVLLSVHKKEKHFFL